MSATETKATHTPGPWAVDGEGAHVARVSSAVEITAPTVSRFDRPDEGRIDADARLMAAAPDLLAALHVAVETIKAWHSMGHFTGETTHVWRLYQSSPEMQQINAAVSKASGR